MLIYYDSQHVMDIHTGQIIDMPKLWGEDMLFTLPQIWNMKPPAWYLQPSKQGIAFLRHIVRVEWCENAGRNLYWGGQWVINGIIYTRQSEMSSLYNAIRNEDLSSGDIYIPHQRTGAVHIIFDLELDAFLAKDAMLARR